MKIKEREREMMLQHTNEEMSEAKIEQANASLSLTRNDVEMKVACSDDKNSLSDMMGQEEKSSTQAQEMQVQPDSKKEETISKTIFKEKKKKIKAKQSKQEIKSKI